ncbi:hypothetical protein EMCRGX_G001998 [Ephydatia muelleri]
MAGFQEQLEQFVEHFEEMQRSPDSDDMFNQEFTTLKAQSQQLKDQEKYSTDSGQLAVNKKKNRFKDILPFEYSRVVLPSIDGVDGSDYINANYIKGCDGETAYIAAQGPLPNTVNDFVRMLWENNTEIIIMACREVEMGKHKCHTYWAELNEEVMFGEILIKTTKEENISNDFVVRELVLVCCGVEKSMRQFHYTAWPDHGVPTSAEPIIRMIEMARECQTNTHVPVVVHCSAGCGRTGTILVVDYMRSLLLSKTMPKDFSVYGLVEQMRTQRPAMVQAKDQYFFVYMACAELARRVLGNKPQPPPKNEETISSLKRATSNQLQNSDDTIYENNPSPPIIPRQISNKPSGGAEGAPTPDSPVPRAAPRVKKSVTPQQLSQSLDKGEEGRDPKKLPLPSEGAPPKSPTIPPKMPVRKETPKTEEKPVVTRNKSASKTAEPKMEETPKSAGKSILDMLMAECGPDIQEAAGVNKDGDGVRQDPPISFSVDSEDAPNIPSRSSDSMELIVSTPATPTVPDSKAKPPPTGSNGNGIYEQPTLWSVPVNKIVPPVIASGPSPHSTISPSTSATAFGTSSSSAGSRSTVQPPKNTTNPRNSKISESDNTEPVKSRTDSRSPVVSNMSATGSGLAISAGPIGTLSVVCVCFYFLISAGFGVRVGKPRGPRPPPSHWKTVQLVL